MSVTVAGERFGIDNPVNEIEDDKRRRKKFSRHLVDLSSLMLAVHGGTLSIAWSPGVSCRLRVIGRVDLKERTPHTHAHSHADREKPHRTSK